ncbi:MAG: hypothetical protein LBH24_06920 [Clostridiales bacterium]|jgi:predicted homoserine dehydrogenase-like protein|nr:hypothetical protein [Clostridiales bacterium]
MEHLKRLLFGREKPIAVGIAGAGEFGVETAVQLGFMRNLKLAAVADLSIERAVDCLKKCGYAAHDIVLAQSAKQANAALESGRPTAMEDGMLLPELLLDAVMDSTGAPAFGAELSYRCLREGKHVIAVNIESDVGVGSILSHLARKQGLVYTQADGDQPSLIKGLFDWAELLGLTTVVAGKWTHIYTDYVYRGGRSLTGYLDGSKNQIEMCSVANAVGFVPDVRGMHKPNAVLQEIPRVFDLKENGGILSRTGVVDVINCVGPKGLIDGHLGGGVFIIVSGRHEPYLHLLKDKGFITNDRGDHALIYRPFHFVGIEAPVSIAKAVLRGEATCEQAIPPTCDVVAVAKRAIKKGETLHGIGGAELRGEIERKAVAASRRLLPLALAEDVISLGDIPADTDLTYDMVRPGTAFIWKLRAMQDELFRDR